MNKAEMADRLAARTGPGKAADREAADSVFANSSAAVPRFAPSPSFCGRRRALQPIPAHAPAPSGSDAFCRSFSS